MIGDITGQRIANALEMDKAFAGTFLLVEGISDQIFFRKFVESSNCQISIAHGKQNIIDAITILNERTFNRVLGIIDKDFDDILSIKHEIENLLTSDFHDLEISILESPAFLHVIETHSDSKKLNEFQNNLGPIKDILYSLASSIGYLRFANKVHLLGLSFKPGKPDGNCLSYSDFIDFKKLSYLGDSALINTVFNYSWNRTVKPASKDEIIKKLTLVKSYSGYDRRHLCNGHDITFIIQLALKRRIGNLNTNECSQKRIELDLIFAYDSSSFIQTNLYNDIKRWEANKQVVILNV